MTTTAEQIEAIKKQSIEDIDNLPELVETRKTIKELYYHIKKVIPNGCNHLRCETCFLNDLGEDGNVKDGLCKLMGNMRK